MRERARAREREREREREGEREGEDEKERLFLKNTHTCIMPGVSEGAACPTFTTRSSASPNPLS